MTKTDETHIRELVTKLQDFLNTLHALRKLLPDTEIRWDCYRGERMCDQVAYFSPSVNTRWDEISFGSGAGHCGYSSYYARAIKIINGIRIRSTKLIFIGSHGNYHGTKPEPDWQQKIREAFGENAVPLVQAHLDTRPYSEYDEDEDENDDDDALFH